jgi:hypothetical protein
MDDSQFNQLLDRFNRARARYTKRDVRMAQVAAIRAGRMSEVAPDLFPETGPWQEPIVANMIDVAARDMSEMIAPLPSFNCSQVTMTREKDRVRATEKTKVALGYVTGSDLQVQMYTAADRYVTYGFVPFKVEVDWDSHAPIIRALDPVGCYPEIDRYGRCVALFQRVLMERDVLVTQFPEFRSRLEQTGGAFGSSEVEVVFYHDKDWDLAFVPGLQGMILLKTKNPIGKCLVRLAARPGVSDVPRGQFDDVIFVQLAKARFALLAIQAAHDAVNAPLVVPSDVADVPYGPGATIRTNQGEKVRRVPLDLPPVAFAEQAQLDRELNLGSRFPETRTGNTDASIVTGKGVQALLGGYDSQVRTHQAIFARTFQELVSLCFEVDEYCFGNEEKSLRGIDNGTPYEIKYRPKKVINGDYTVDVTYGLMAGLDPNRWLVFALQARAEKMFSRDFMRREMPVDIDVEDEARKIDIEDLEEAAKLAIMGYAQSIPALAAQGQDPAGPVQALAKVIEGRRSGRPLADLVVEAFTPEPEPEPEQDPMAALMGGGDPGMGGMPGGPSPDGLMPGVAPGQQGMAPGGMPDLSTLIAGLGAGGRPNLSASVQRRMPV